MKVVEGLLYEAVMLSLCCGAVWGVQSAARYDLRVLVIDEVPYRRDVPIGHPAATPPGKILPHFCRSGKNISYKDASERPGTGPYRSCAMRVAIGDTLKAVRTFFV